MTPAELKRIRKHTKLSQYKFAVELGVTPQTINAWENGKTPISAIATQLIRLKYTTGEKK